MLVLVYHAWLFALLVYESSCDLEKITGGTKGSIETFPYLASLLYNNHAICGSALISPDTALTAAHCVPKHGMYSIRAGSNYTDKGGVVTYVKNAILHPGYSKDTEDFDLAILKLTEPLQLSDRIRPVKLPKQDESPPPDLKGVVSGWGSLSSFVVFLPDQLRAVDLPVLDRSDCVKAYKSVTRITERMFCAGYRQGGHDSCQGDSGGPFVINGTLYGLVSWGFNCGEPGYPGVYTNISTLRTYIQLNTDI